MTAPDTCLTTRRCLPCEGGIPALSPEEARRFLEQVPGWEITGDGRRIVRSWKTGNFVEAIQQFELIRDLAEAEQHHPDLHLTEYRNVRVEIWTHAVGGLTENDFILAAKIEDMLHRNIPTASA